MARLHVELRETQRALGERADVSPEYVKDLEVRLEKTTAAFNQTVRLISSSSRRADLMSELGGSPSGSSSKGDPLGKDPPASSRRDIGIGGLIDVPIIVRFE